MLAAVVLGAMGGVRVHDSWARHVAVVDAACLALTTVGTPGAPREKKNTKTPDKKHKYMHPFECLLLRGFHTRDFQTSATFSISNWHLYFLSTIWRVVVFRPSVQGARLGSNHYVTQTAI